METANRLPIVDRRIRFALVGCGRISKNHLAALAEHSERAEIVALCDNNPAALAAPGLECERYASLAQMLETADVDIVTLATPSGLHPQQAIAVARSGRQLSSAGRVAGGPGR